MFFRSSCQRADPKFIERRTKFYTPKITDEKVEWKSAHCVIEGLNETGRVVQGGLAHRSLKWRPHTYEGASGWPPSGPGRHPTPPPPKPSELASVGRRNPGRAECKEQTTYLWFEIERRGPRPSFLPLFLSSPQKTGPWSRTQLTRIRRGKKAAHPSGYVFICAYISVVVDLCHICAVCPNMKICLNP